MALFLVNEKLTEKQAQSVNRMLINFLKKLKNWVDPNYWGQVLGDKTGAFEKALSKTIPLFANSAIAGISAPPLVYKSI